MVLRRDHFIAVADQQLDDLAETGSVGPQAMCEDDAGFAGHAAPPKTVTSLSDLFGRRVRTGERPAGSVGEFKPLRVFFNRPPSGVKRTSLTRSPMSVNDPKST